MELIKRDGYYDFHSKPLNIQVQFGGDGKNLFIVDSSQHPNLPPFCMLTRIGKKHTLDCDSEKILKLLNKGKIPLRIEYVSELVAEEKKEVDPNAAESVSTETFYQKACRYVATGTHYVVHFVTIFFCLVMGWYFFGLAMAHVASKSEYSKDAFLRNIVATGFMIMGAISVLIRMRWLVIIFDIYVIVYGIYLFMTGFVKDISNQPVEDGEIRGVENYLPGFVLVVAGIIRFKYWWWKYYPRLEVEDLLQIEQDVNGR